jgi:ATP-dependent RNA helicase DeaD
MTNEFDNFGLHPQLVQAIAERGYAAPTPIQEGVIPLMLAGQDVLGQAQTGTGKTAAFSLPILHAINPKKKRVQALVVAPTRELASQVAQAIYAYGRLRDVRVLAIYGGQSYGRQINRLNKGVDVVVGTPGRLLDLIRQKQLDLSDIQTLVLDEADEMLSMGFIEDIEAILQETPASRQTALFSATLPNEIRRLADNYMRNPQSVTIQKKQLTVDAIEQRAYLVNESDKLAALTRLFEMEEITSALIFTRTRVSSGDLASALTVQGYPAEALNGDLSQDAREQVLNRFKQNQSQVLVATDVAARGLDIDDISHVFNYDLPNDPDSFVHRVGRTGRAGKDGVAISFVTPGERGRLRRIEHHARQKITMAELPTEAEIFAHRDTQLMKQMEVWLIRDRCRKEKDMASELIEAGYDPIDIAAAALKLARAEEKQRPIAAIRPIEENPQRERGRRRASSSNRNDRRKDYGRSRDNGQSNGSKNGRKSSKRSHEAGMVRLVLNAGKAQGVRPGDVVGTIAFHADIPGSTLGAILIEHQNTFVDVPEKFVTRVLDKSDRYQIHRQSVTIEPAN